MDNERTFWQKLLAFLADIIKIVIASAAVTLVNIGFAKAFGAAQPPISLKAV